MPGPKSAWSVALAHAVDVWLVAVVIADGHAAAEVFRGADLAEVVVAAELAVGVASDPVQQATGAGRRRHGGSGRGTPGRAGGRGSRPAGRKTT